ncbi:MAG: dCMP deaminase family protein [Amoebophilaceae bacterium]|nr:dCMP deaminase family protein [Amoebophilaceae bacterium]
MKTTLDDLFMSLAVQLTQYSHCVKKQVAAVLTKDRNILATGYNGPPVGTYNCNELWPKTGCPRSLQGNCSLAIHAEQQVIMYALMHQVATKGTTLYTTLSPCLPCARIIFGAGIQKVIYKESYANYKGLIEEEGLNFLDEFGVITAQYKK